MLGTDKLAEVSSNRRGFASDTAAGIHPAVLEAIAAANSGHAFGYGHDSYTEGVEAMLRSFSQDDRDHMVENGKISVTCEFCSATYLFEPEEVADAKVN